MERVINDLIRQVNELTKENQKIKTASNFLL